MTLASGALTCKRFQLLSTLQSMDLHDVFKRLAKNTIREIDLADAREEASGWCHPFSGQPDLVNLQDLVHDNMLVFGIRTDSKKIPATLMRLQMRMALKNLVQSPTKSSENQKARVPKKKRDEIKERIKYELLTHILPQVRITEVVWHLDSQELWLMGGSQKLVQEFEKLFFESFGMPLIQITPGTLAVDFDRMLSGIDVQLAPMLDLAPADILYGLPKNSPTALTVKDSQPAF